MPEDRAGGHSGTTVATDGCVCGYSYGYGGNRAVACGQLSFSWIAAHIQPNLAERQRTRSAKSSSCVPKRSKRTLILRVWGKTAERGVSAHTSGRLPRALVAGVV